MALTREAPSRRATNASTTMTGYRSASSSAASRPGVRQPTKRASTARPQLTSTSLSSATSSSRFGRAGAISPAESLMSVATTAAAGLKRKERDFEAAAAADNDSVILSLAEETNINVVVRCRGRNEREVRENSAVVVNTDGAMGKNVELMMGPNALSNKTYNFDRVFSPAADQAMIFDDVVRPILDEMLTGFNCTIFAYGQTGTGKTYTMSGDMSESLGLLTDAAGIIPRVLQALFNKLNADESTDSVVRCSFIELYNEELRDLLSVDSDGSSSSKLKIYDDNSRKGHATTVVQGMEERHIASAADGIKRLQEGSVRRQVAATKCNDLSSRSHTVFTITVQTKHITETGEDFFNTGKLNLVDLAGSENIQRSGAENKRAAEAGLINKSLLTLGRVINALVDRTAHVPYRESKLTRLLQDSLGGRTKTCIIATISTAKSNLEETISTLDYAFRAKNIRNKPQVNQLINKKTLLREFTAEIEKLKCDLIATRQRNGVYLPNDTYEEMTVQSESRRILAEEQAAKIETMEANLRHKLQELLELTSNFMGLKKEHEDAKTEMSETKDVLGQTELVLSATRKTLAEETYVRQAHQSTEEKLASMGNDLISTLERTVGDIDGLRAKNRRKSDLQGVNRNAWAGSQAQVSEVTRLVESRILGLRASQEQHISNISRRMQSFVEEGQQSLASTQALLDQNLASFEASKYEMLAQQGASKQDLDQVLQEIRAVRDHIQEHVGESLQTIASAAERIAEDVLSELSTFHNQLHTSYSTLGKDFKSTFEDLLKHIGAQRDESDALRTKVEEASQTAVQANATVAAQIQQAIDEERKQAAADRQQLLTQIGTLITEQATKQDIRFTAKTNAIREQMVESNTAFEGSLETYAKGMDAWNTASEEFAQGASESRDALKLRLQEDWTTANEHSTSIQNTTRSVHAETVRVVGEQMKDLDVKMQDLDNLVTRATSSNDEHLAEHTASVSKISETVTATFSELSAHAQETIGRGERFMEEAEADIKGQRSDWEPTEGTLCQPLNDLRACISNTALREYVPTGETPEKVQYTYPLDLPRTAPHHVLISGLNNKGTVSSKTEESGDIEDDILGDDDDEFRDELLDTMPSPSKPPVNSDSATVPVVFNDFDASASATEPESNGTFTRASSQPPSAAPVSSIPSMGMSLREVNPNLTTGSTLFDPGASTMSLKGNGGKDGSHLGLMAASIEGAKNAGATKGSSNGSGHGHTLPTYRRRSLRQNHGPPPAKQAKTRTSVMTFEGRENVPPAAFSQSLSRRRSPRLN
ncbi:kinesin family member 11 [Sporothrix brasiliensis 5110]|uniref:Kinesin family member 11 n=1 Tax=Sporothrix brasiliensis 5110 TaxID=1398154 RepID=A0A0C2ESP6_9PEZI|nr:kinesin family member 11 [Sporothrix brasiliensis 5110]KIH89409.1 kinesin family member 11 [Sporothrix brasiliensis 5110]